MFPLQNFHICDELQFLCHNKTVAIKKQTYCIYVYCDFEKKKILKIQHKLCNVAVPHITSVPANMAFCYSPKPIFTHIWFLAALKPQCLKVLVKVPPSGPAPGCLSEQVFNCLLPICPVIPLHQYRTRPIKVKKTNGRGCGCIL